MGRVKGSAGNMTGCKMYSNKVMRAKAFEVANPKTAAQTTQRDFFAEVSQVVSSVTDAELRTLFPQLPKRMARRNLLNKQIAAANTVVGNVKSVDFSKLNKIGNGPEIDVAMYHIASVAAGTYTLSETASTLGIAADSSANLIVILFNVTKGTVSLLNTSLDLEDQDFNAVDAGCSVGDEVYFFPTVSVKGDDVSLRGFGSFIIKTRDENGGRRIDLGSNQPSREVTIECQSFAQYANFQFDLSGTVGEGGTPLELICGDKTLASSFNNVSGNVYAGSLLEAVSEELEAKLDVMSTSDEIETLSVKWSN